MDENISHAISMMGATFLFMVAFSCAVVFYNGLEDRADEFFEATSVSTRQEDATMVQTSRDNIDRKIYFEEIFLAILNLPTYVSNDGNAHSSKILIGYGDASGDFICEGTYVASYDVDTNLKLVELKNSAFVIDILYMIISFCSICFSIYSISNRFSSILFASSYFTSNKIEIDSFEIKLIPFSNVFLIATISNDSISTCLGNLLLWH